MRSLCFIALLVTSATLFAGEFKSKVIQMNDSIMIPLEGDQVLFIRNFTQDGGTTRGTVTIRKSNTLVLTATILTTSNSNFEPVNSIVVSGGAEVTVTCGDGNSCFISYKKDIKQPE
ncbi:MAG: hypothetical protein QOG48_40 [Verrucomicrobiota bacterium]|jgi:hypothetical protein